MKVEIDFGPIVGSFTPEAVDLAIFFMRPSGPFWFTEAQTDNASLSFRGLNDTAHLPMEGGRIDSILNLWGEKNQGVMLFYWYRATGRSRRHFSKGDMGRLGTFRRTAHGDLSPLAFYIPFDRALVAVKEFISTNGELPTSIEWVSSNDVPPNTFPEPHDPEFAHIR